MADPITVSALTQVGRANAPDPNLPRVFVTYNADFSGAADITFDFSILNQQQIFGIIRTIFIDNGSNPEPVGVWVSITDQYFTVPAFAQGTFNINAADKSLIRLITNGGATDQVTVVFYNYVVAPAVWYSYGTQNVTAVTVADGADVALGDTSDVAWNGVTATSTVIAALKAARLSLGGIADAAWNGVAANASVIATLKAIWNAITTRQGAYTDRSINNLTGASQALMAANAARRVLVLNNPNAVNPIAVNLSGGAAVLNTAGSLTIAAGQTVTINEYPTTSAITVIGTAGEDITAYEG